MKLKWLIFFLIIIIVIVLGSIFYQDELSLIFSNPKAFLDKVLIAGGFLNTTIYFFFLNLTVVVVSLLIELALLGWNKSAFRRILRMKDKSTMGDLMCWLLSLVGLYDFFTFISTFGLFYLLNGVIHSAFFIGLGEFVGNDMLLFAIIFVLSDLKQYAWHWTLHKLSPLWEVHKYHHSATKMNLITSSRGHFLGKGVATVFDALFFALIGAPPLLYVGLYLGREIWSMWLHADIHIRISWFGRYILMTPQLHKVHHSTEPRHFNKNFGTFFIFWDRIFGTFHEVEEVKSIGIKDDPYNQSGFWKDMVLGFRLFAKAMIPHRFRS